MRRRWARWVFGLSLVGLMNACGRENLPQGAVPVNSRYNDEQPELSGDGRFVTFVSNRDGKSLIRLYDLARQQFVELPGLEPREVPQSPSLSRTGRYIAYLVYEKGRPEIALYDRITDRSEILTRFYRHQIRNPQISPDGRYIVFESARRGQWDIEVLDRGPNIELDIADGTPVVGP